MQSKIFTFRKIESRKNFKRNTDSYLTTCHIKQLYLGSTLKSTNRNNEFNSITEVCDIISYDIDPFQVVDEIIIKI